MHEHVPMPPVWFEQVQSVDLVIQVVLSSSQQLYPPLLELGQVGKAILLLVVVVICVFILLALVKVFVEVKGKIFVDAKCCVVRPFLLL